MQNSTLYGKKKKKLPKCPNPLFVEWLGEWQTEAAEKNAKSQFTYKKALNTLLRYPLPLKTGKDCKILENFGDKICKMLDDKLQKYMAEHGTDQPIITLEEEEKMVTKKNVKHTQKRENQGEVTKARRIPAAVHELSDSDSDEQQDPQPPARKRQRSGTGNDREYIPQLRSGPYALLLALYRHMQDPDSVGYLSKNDLIKKAQPLADKSFNLPDPGSRYTGWSSMGTLIKKGYVIKDSSPAKYSLTDKGCELAHKLEAVEVDCADVDNIPFRINEPDVVPPTTHVAPPTSHIAPPTDRLPSMHFSDNKDDIGGNNADSYQRFDSGLKYWYVTADDREVIYKDQAMVTVEDDIGVGFLVKCNYTAALRAGVKYKLDMSRPHRDDFCYLYLSNEDATEIARPPYTHNTNNASQTDGSSHNVQPGGGGSPRKANSDNPINNPKPKPQKKKTTKSTKTEGLQLLPLVTNNDNFRTMNEQESKHTSDIMLIEDENKELSSLGASYSDKNKVPYNNRTGVTPYLSDSIKTGVPPSNGLYAESSQEGSQSTIKSITDSSQSSVGSSLPEPDFVLLPGQFDIVLCVDNAEFYGQSKGSSKTLLPDLMKNGIQCDLRKLHVGDLLWIAKERVRPLPGQLETPKGRELVLNYIIERKRMDDLVSSCIDGRYKEQKFRLKKCGLKHLIYLIEDYGSLQHFSLPEATIRQTITNTQIVDEFRVKRTKDSKETVAFLTVLTRYLQSSFRDKTLYASSLESIKEANIPYSVDDIQQRLPTFDEFNQGSVKTKALTVREMFGKQLIQIYGMSAEKALAVTDKYPTPSALFRAYRCCTTEKEKENLLSTIKCGKANRSLGTAQSKQIYQLYNTKSALQ